MDHQSINHEGTISRAAIARWTLLGPASRAQAIQEMTPAGLSSRDGRWLNINHYRRLAGTDAADTKKQEARRKQCVRRIRYLCVGPPAKALAGLDEDLADLSMEVGRRTGTPLFRWQNDVDLGVLDSLPPELRKRVGNSWTTTEPLARAYAELRLSYQQERHLNQRFTGVLPSQIATRMLNAHHNHFPALEEHAVVFRRELAMHKLARPLGEESLLEGHSSSWMEAPLFAKLNQSMKHKGKTIWHGVELVSWEAARQRIVDPTRTARTGRPRSAWLESQPIYGYKGMLAKEQLSRSRLFSLILLRAKQQAKIHELAPNLLDKCSKDLHAALDTLPELGWPPGSTGSVRGNAFPTVDSRIDAILQHWVKSSPSKLDLGSWDSFQANEDAYRACRRALRGYWAAAVLMPLIAFRERAKGLAFDIQLLGNEFDVSWETCAHRLTTLKASTDDPLIPALHLIRVDEAGNVNKYFSMDKLALPASWGSGCPRWAVHRSLQRPGEVVLQLSRVMLPNGKVTEHVCVSRARRKGRGGHQTPHPLHGLSLGCALEDAPRLTYFSNFSTEDWESWTSLGAARNNLQQWKGLPVSQQGISCIECPRPDCTQRNYKFIKRTD